MAKTPNKRIFYEKPTAAATKAEASKQRGRIARLKAKQKKEMAAMKKSVAAAMKKFKKGKKTTKAPAKRRRAAPKKKGIFGLLL